METVAETTTICPLAEVTKQITPEQVKMLPALLKESVQNAILRYFPSIYVPITQTELGTNLLNGAITEIDLEDSEKPSDEAIISHLQSLLMWVQSEPILNYWKVIQLEQATRMLPSELAIDLFYGECFRLITQRQYDIQFVPFKRIYTYYLSAVLSNYLPEYELTEDRQTTLSVLGRIVRFVGIEAAEDFANRKGLIEIREYTFIPQLGGEITDAIFLRLKKPQERTSPGEFTMSDQAESALSYLKDKIGTPTRRTAAAIQLAREATIAYTRAHQELEKKGALIRHTKKIAASLEIDPTICRHFLEIYIGLVGYTPNL